MTALEAAMGHASPAAVRSDSPFLRSGVLIMFREPVTYSAAWTLQQQFHAERLSGSRTDTLMLLEHLPVYTAGRGTRADHLKPSAASWEEAAIPIETVNRGGSVTYHGPGQLVAYPILALSQHAPGAKAYVHLLEEVIIRTLLSWDIQGYRVAKTPGVWTRDRGGEAKIASIGTRIDQGITLHGFSLNVMNDLGPFSRIVPCGIDGCRMTSVAEIRQSPIPVQLVAEHLANDFSAIFRLEWTSRLSDGATATGIDAHPVAITKAQ